MCKGDTFIPALICSVTMSEWTKVTVWICDNKTSTFYEWLKTWYTNSPTTSICRHVTKCVSLHWFRRVNFIDAIFIPSAWIIPQYLRTINTFLVFFKKNFKEYLYAYDRIFSSLETKNDFVFYLSLVGRLIKISAVTATLYDKTTILISSLPSISSSGTNQII